MKHNVTIYRQIIRCLWLLALLFVTPAGARSLRKADIQLANSAVLSMFQDTQGYMWFGTYDGFHLYDGKDTYVYRVEQDSRHSLCSNVVLGVHAAGPDALWLYTSMGLNRFSLQERCVTESFTQYVDAERVVADSLGNTLLFGRRDFISFYNNEYHTFEDVYFPGLDPTQIAGLWSPKVNEFCSISRTGEVALWHLDPQAKIAVSRVATWHILGFDIRKAFYVNNNIYFVDEASGILWRGTDQGHRVEKVADLSSLNDKCHTVSTITYFGKDLYVGFFSGGFIRLANGGPGWEEIAMDYRVFCLWGDRNQDIVWVGTDGYGAYMYCDHDRIFSTLMMEDLPQPVRKPVRALCTDGAGDLWIGTKGDGVVRVSDYATSADKALSRSRVTRFGRAEGLLNDEVFCFEADSLRNLLWMGTRGPGLAYYSYRDKRIHPLERAAGSDAIYFVHSLCLMNDSTLYAGSDGVGLLEITLSNGERPEIKSLETHRFRHNHTDCNDFYAMVRESDSTLLLGMRGGSGIIRFYTKGRKYEFVDMKSLQRMELGDILCVCKNRNGELFCGASSGLLRVSGEGEVRQFDRRNGMANDMIHGVVEDNSGCLWLSTNKGLVRYNPENDFFHNFLPSEMKLTEYSDDAHYKCPRTGRIFFGGVNGVVWIDAATQSATQYKPALHFVELSCSDGSVHSLVRDPLAEPIRIAPGITEFTASFVAVDYLNGDNFEYSYLLEGHTTSWVELQKNNKVSFSNLPPGNYVLKVRYKSNVSDAAGQICLLPIRVLPPWYRTTFALICYLLAVVGVAWLIFFRVRLHLRKERQLLVARIEEQQREKLYEARLNFFVNISHELCTPLTLINGMNERLGQLATGNEQLSKLTEVMHDNVKGLNDLIQEILDFRKIEEAGFGPMHISQINVAEVIRSQVHSFEDIAERNGIRLELRVADSLMWNTDVAFLRKIVLNLISNALKYTPIQGDVRIEAIAEEQRLIMRVRNTGQGIAPALLATIFDRYRILDNMDTNMYRQTASRNGLGLFICHELVQALGGQITVRSEVGEFAEFIVSLPQQEATATPSATQHPATIDVAPQNATTSHKPSVLVVDDNKDVVWLISSALSSDYQVCTCGSVAEAITFLEAQMPDLIITDIVMPGESGLSLIRRVRSDRFMRRVPIIVVSAKVTDQEQAEGFGEGADAYLTKPFSVPVLCAAVKRLITGSQTLKAYYHTSESAYTLTDGQLMHQTDKAFMESVLAVLDEHLCNEDLRMELIADKLGLTTRNFCRKFKKVTERTPSDYIKNYRFEYAARLLITTDRTIQEIMYQAGISNKSYFYREFQKKYNMKPKEYRSKS